MIVVSGMFLCSASEGKIVVVPAPGVPMQGTVGGMEGEVRREVNGVSEEWYC